MPSGDVHVADRVVECLHPFAQDVGAIIPEGFEAYVRIFHPASRREGDGEVEVRWAEIAAWSGRVVHAVMQFEPIATPVPGRDPGPRPWDGTTPRDGTLPLSHTASLAGQLGEFTTTPETCWF